MQRTLVVVVLALSGCAGIAPHQASGPSPGDLTRIVGDQFVGRSIMAMTTRYGAPIRQQQIGGETVMSWERSVTKTYSQPPYEEVYRCQLDAYVTPAGIVRTLGFSGKLGGCDPFIP